MEDKAQSPPPQLSHCDRRHTTTECSLPVRSPFGSRIPAGAASGLHTGRCFATTGRCARSRCAISARRRLMTQRLGCDGQDMAAPLALLSFSNLLSFSPPLPRSSGVFHHQRPRSDSRCTPTVEPQVLQGFIPPPSLPGSCQLHGLSGRDSGESLSHLLVTCTPTACNRPRLRPERHIRVGQRPSRPPQVLGDGRRPPQCQEGLFLLPHRLAAGPQAS